MMYCEWKLSYNFIELGKTTQKKKRNVRHAPVKNCYYFFVKLAVVLLATLVTFDCALLFLCNFGFTLCTSSAASSSEELASSRCNSASLLLALCNSLAAFFLFLSFASELQPLSDFVFGSPLPSGSCDSSSVYPLTALSISSAARFSSSSTDTSESAAVSFRPRVLYGPVALGLLSFGPKSLGMFSQLSRPVLNKSWTGLFVVVVVVDLSLTRRLLARYPTLL